MTRQEYEQRTKQTVSPEDYSQIENIYMNTNLDKDAFCADYKKHSDSVIIAELQKTIEKQEKSALAREINRLQTADLVHEIAEALIGKSKVYNDPDLRDMAVRLIGENEVVKATVKMQLPLGEDDAQYIMTILNRE